MGLGAASNARPKMRPLKDALVLAESQYET